MRYRPVQKMGRRRPPTPIFNILIRNAYRPTLFSTCIQSVLSQTYTNYRIIMCYDNNRSLEYLSSLKGYSNITIFKASKVDKQQSGFYNLYMNELLSKVNNGWILFLDDDDKFMNNNVLTKIAAQITSIQDFILWKVKLGPELVYPRNIHEIEMGKFTGIGCCFNSKFKDYGKWYAKLCSDYMYIWEILKNNKAFQRTFINDILTGTIHNQSGSKGKSEKYNILDFQEFIHKHKLTQVFVSDSLKHLQPRLLSLFNLKEYYNRSLPALFFGIYNKQDFQYIHNHTSLSYLMFGGSDVHNYEKCNPSIIFVAISTDIQTRIKQDSILIKFTLVDKTIFKPYHSQGNKIFIFDGRLKKDSNRITYGATYYDEVVNRLPNHEFIYSSDLNMPYEKMPEIYSQCFIGLRLTHHDGNANTVQELEAMNIPVIHNQSEYGLKWKNIDDILMHIKKTASNINFIDKVLSISLNNGNVNYNKNIQYKTKINIYVNNNLLYENNMIKNIVLNNNVTIIPNINQADFAFTDDTNIIEQLGYKGKIVITCQKHDHPNTIFLDENVNLLKLIIYHYNYDTFSQILIENMKLFKNNEQRKKTVVFVPVWNRHDILKKCINSIKNQTESCIILGICSTISDYNFLINNNISAILTFNKPLGMKYQFGMEFSKIYYPKNVIIMGSDDIMTLNYIEQINRYIDDYDVVGLKYWKMTHNNINYLVEYNHKLLNKPGTTLWGGANSNYSKIFNTSYLGFDVSICKTFPFTIGAGRSLGYKILNKVGWKIYQNLPRCLDTNSLFNLLMINKASYKTVDKEPFHIISYKNSSTDMITTIQDYMNSPNLLINKL